MGLAVLFLVMGYIMVRCACVYVCMCIRVCVYVNVCVSLRVPMYMSICVCDGLHHGRSLHAPPLQSSTYTHTKSPTKLKCETIQSPSLPPHPAPDPHTRTSTYTRHRGRAGGCAWPASGSFGNGSRRAPVNCWRSSRRHTGVLRCVCILFGEREEVCVKGGARGEGGICVEGVERGG